MPSLEMCSPRHELALLASIAISVCGSTLLQHPALQQPLLCATAWLCIGPLESKDTKL